MTYVIGKIISIMKKASKDFEILTIHKSGCMLYIMISMNLKQIVAIKFSSRKHYITKALAVKYLQSTHKTIDSVAIPKLRKEAYVLNILVGDHISPSCSELVNVKLKNMDMVYNSKRVDDVKIIQSICNALYHKTESWAEKIKKSCNDKGIRPYGPQKLTINRLNIAMNVFWKYGKGGVGKHHPPTFKSDAIEERCPNCDRILVDDNCINCSQKAEAKK